MPRTFMQKLPLAKYFAAMVILWGIVTALTACVRNATQLIVCRVFLGLFEAAIGPCLTIIIAQWYTKEEQGPRLAFWYCGLGTGQIIGGLVSWAFQHVNGGIGAWRWMFICLGVVTSIMGFIAGILLPDSPMKASFLIKAEADHVIRRVAANKTGIRNTYFKPRHLLELALDLQIYLQFFLTALIGIAGGVISNYSATIIKNLGYSSKDAALLNMPSGLVSIISTLITGYCLSRWPRTSRAYLTMVLCVPTIAAGCLMSFLPNSNRVGILIGVWLVNCIVPVLIIVYSWVAANVAGHTKRTAAVSLMSAAFSIGNIIGPYTFQAKDGPEYRPAKITLLSTEGAGLILAFCLLMYYIGSNQRRSELHNADLLLARSHSRPHTDDYKDMTDKENRAFQYVY